MYTWNSINFDVPDLFSSDKFNGVFVDIVQYSDGSWTVMYDGTIIRDGFANKYEADDYLVDFVERRSKIKSSKIYGQAPVRYAA